MIDYYQHHTQYLTISIYHLIEYDYLARQWAMVLKLRRWWMVRLVATLVKRRGLQPRMMRMCQFWQSRNPRISPSASQSSHISRFAEPPVGSFSLQIWVGNQTIQSNTVRDLTLVFDDLDSFLWTTKGIIVRIICTRFTEAQFVNWGSWLPFLLWLNQYWQPFSAIIKHIIKP